MTQPVAQGLDPRQGVVDFHRAHYSANVMRLAVYGREVRSCGVVGPGLKGWQVGV